MSDAEKAAEEYARSIQVDKNYPFELSGVAYFDQHGKRITFSSIFLAGAAWAAPKWKCPPEYPNEGDLIVIKRVDEDDSWTYHLSRSRRSIPIMSAWMLIEPDAPKEEK